MTNTVLLNNIDHKDIKVITTHGEKYGDGVMACLTFPGEFRTLQAHYPIFFQKDSETGQFVPVALFGFEQNENLFLKGEQWDASYVPAMIERLPFSIGLKSGEANQHIINVDLDSPKISKTEGQELFLEFGGNAPHLEKIAELLGEIHKGMLDNEDFADKLLELDLIESFQLDIELNDGSRNQLVGFYTINEEKVYQLDAQQLESLNQTGFLSCIYMMLASQSQLSELIKRKNAKL